MIGFRWLAGRNVQDFPPRPRNISVEMTRPGRILTVFVAIAVFALTPAHASGTLASLGLSHSETYQGTDPAACRFTQSWAKSPTKLVVRSISVKGLMTCPTAYPISGGLVVKSVVPGSPWVVNRSTATTTADLSLVGSFVPPVTGGLYEFEFNLYFDYDLSFYFTNGWPHGCDTYSPQYDLAGGGPDPYNDWDPYQLCSFSVYIFVPPQVVRTIQNQTQPS